MPGPTEDAPFDGGRARRLAEIVGAALDVPPAERSAFLAAACGGDAALLREAEALLAADRTEEGFAAPPPPSQNLIGTALSHYRIVERLGAGGMGEVYLAEDGKLGRRVALKVLPREVAGHPERLARFRREARTVAALNHPNIVTLHSIEDVQGLHFLTMELVEGATLQKKIVPGGLPLDELLRLALPLADAVAAAHAQGIAHRDLKPANVMIAGDGRVKVLDFGISKGLEHRAASTSITLDGRVLGTVPYMAPEQLAGHPADRRSDVFSLGIVLFELATGAHPLTSPNAPLPPRLRPILQRCLEKDPDRRYQDAGELAEDLRALQDNAGRSRRRRGLALAVGLLLLIAGLAGVVLWNGRETPEAAVSVAPEPARKAMAVLQFQNLTGDPQLDWLRAGLPEMLVTDLSQLPQLDVLGTARLAQILAERGASGDLARRAAVQEVIRGSYAQVEGRVLISFQVEDAATGRILGSGRVQGPGGEQLLSLMDELAVAVHRELHVAASSAAAPKFQDVTTSSVEAWQLYIEALQLHNQAKTSEAAVLLEKAVELDPDFALALADLGTLHGNLGHRELSRSYLGRAVAKAERLPAHQRWLIQGRYYADRWSTYGKALASFQETLRLYPNRDTPRNNLANLEASLERYDSALQDYERLLAQGTRFASTTVSAANAYAALDRFEEGHRLLLDLAAREPESWIAHAGLGWLLTLWGRLDEADAALERAAALRRGNDVISQTRWRIAVLREDWARAERAARELESLGDPYARWRGGLSRARNAQFRGDFPAALDHLAAATRAFPRPEPYTAMAHCWTADLLLDLGEPARALAEARRAQEIAPGDWPELQGMYLAALAQQDLGRPAEADALLAGLKRRAAVTPNSVEERQILHLEGRLALARGNPESAAASLRRAASLLPPRGVEIHRYVQPDHVPVWVDLARAELAAGRPEQARRWLEKATASGAEHIEFPVSYARGAELLKRLRPSRP